MILNFQNLIIVFNGHHVHKTKLFYYIPITFRQKKKIKNNDESITKYNPKKSSFDDYTQTDINIMFNLINSLKRIFL